jgi:hypothetical protein
MVGGGEGTRKNARTAGGQKCTFHFAWGAGVGGRGGNAFSSGRCISFLPVL